MKSKLILLVLPVAIVLGIVFLVPVARAADTGFLTFSSNAAVTTDAGDNDGLETTPGNATSSDNAYAGSTNSGTVASASCSLPNTSSDQHDFFNFGFSVPSASAIAGIEVTTEALYSSDAGTNTLCVFLSWDNGTTWTAGKNTPDIGTVEAVNNLGGATDIWGRTWAASELGNGNFRVRVMTLVSNIARDLSLDYLAVKVYYELPHFEQSGYRWFRNTDSPDLASFVSNPSTSTDTIYGMDLDKADEIIYLAGNTVTATGSDAWKIERRGAKTGFLNYSVTVDPSTANDNPRDLEFVSTENRIYIVGFDNVPGNREWRIEKRKARTGELVYAVTNNPSSGTDEARAIAVDAGAGFMYVVGTDSAGGDEGWRIEKRNTSDGSLVYATSSNFSASSDSAETIAIDKDGGHMYVGGSESASSTDSMWRIEKRNLSDGLLIFSTTTNPSSGLDNLNTIAIGSSSMFIAGRDRALDNGQWRIERRSTSTGALMYATTSNPSGGMDEVIDIEVHDNKDVMYVVGEESNAWRIEKRKLGDGAFVTAFGTNGAVTSNPSGSADVPKAAVLDKNDDNLYIAGRDAILGDGEWRVERYNANNGNTNWGNSLGATNASSTFPARRTAVRLRTLIHIATSTLATSSQSFKLQHATSSGVCDTGFSGETYTDVATSTGDIRFGFELNPGVSGGAAALPNFRDPTHSGHNVVEQTYVDSGTFTSTTSIPVGEDGLWDFALENFSAPAGTTYCFRVVKSDGSLLDTYSQIPEITTSASLSSGASQVFEYNQTATSASAITVTASAGSGGAITTANDIRVKVDSALAKMEWDTMKTTPTFGGTASGKVASTVTYPDAKTLLIDVSSDFASGDTLTVSGLAFSQFTGVNAAAAVLKLYVDGASDADDDDNDDKKIAVRGKLSQKDHGKGQLESNSFDADSATLTAVRLYRFRVDPVAENITVGTTTVNVSSYSGFTASNFTNLKLFLDLDGSGSVDGGDTQIGGGGVITLGAATGTIVFAEDWTATTTRDVILRGDVANVDEGDYIAFSLPDLNIAAVGDVSLESIPVRGLVVVKNHGRPLKRFGGGGGAEGGSPGGGSEGGGGSGGGETSDPGGGEETGGGSGGGGGAAPTLFCAIFPKSTFCKPFEIEQPEFLKKLFML
ncbi:MAG: hypothetical protein HY378_00020 [Candidatus Brennerbacteria bacterium]|nr:hypothetical protein [Candidatus Brennerbacteria bacterium]